MKYIISFLRIIVAMYLAALAITGLVLFSQKRSGKIYPNIKDYSYYVVENNKLLPEYQPSTFVVVKSEDYYNFKEGDYVVVKENDMQQFKLILRDGNETNPDEILVGYTNADEAENTIIKKSDVLAVGIYHSGWLTICYQLLTNWIVILILILFLLLSSNITYKRFEL